MTDSNQSVLGRVRLVKGTPPCAPGKCVLCGDCGNKDSEFIDFGFELDFYGVIYFCQTCIIEISSVLDFVPKKQLEEVKDNLARATFALDAMTAQVEELSSVINSLKRFDVILGDSSSSEQPTVVEVAPTSKQSARKTTPAKSRYAKQINESGSTGVHNNDSSEESADKFQL
jgi:hypothetical protein